MKNLFVLSSYSATASKVNKYIVLMAAVFVVLLSSGLSQAQEKCETCDSVLKLGQQVISISSNSSENEDTKTWFCSDKFEQELRNSRFSAGITVPIEGIPLNFKLGSDNAQAWQRRETFCSDQSRKFNRVDTYSLFHQLADPNVVREWGRCIENACSVNNSSSFELKLNRAGQNQVNVTLKWRPRFTGEQPPVITSISRANLNCPDTVIKPTATVNIEGFAEICTADRRRESTLIINTTGGPASKTLTRNLNGIQAGTARLSGSMTVKVWRPNGGWTRDITTGDHHCGGGIFGCSGEGRRTRYELDITVGADERLSNPRFTCISGPCQGWFHVWHVNITPDRNRAYTAFDVWSHSTVWRLAVDSEKLADETRYFSASETLFYGREITFTVPRNRNRAEVQVTLNGNRFSVKLGESRPGLFIYVNKSTSGDNELFTYRVETPSE